MARVAPYRSFTQGTIFSCGRAEAYVGTEVHGIVVTARCDAAHGKANIINYVPVVPFTDWGCVDGFRIVAKRAAGDALGQMKSALRDAGMAHEILETQTAEDLIEELQKSSEKGAGKIADRFSNAVAARSRAEAALMAEPTVGAAAPFLAANSRLCGTLVRELLGHGLAEFHYLESIDEEEDCDGYVIMLREIRFLPAIIVEPLSNGMGRDEFEMLIPNLLAREAIQLSFEGQDPYAMPISTVQSPDIELIVQRLTQLFARVGVRDVEQGRISRLQSALARMGEDGE